MADQIIPNDDPGARHRLALEAAWQTEALSHMVLAELERLDVEGDSGIKSAIVRIGDLSRVVMSALNDEAEDLSRLRCKIHGRVTMEVQHG